jgi:hypothetical protein
MALLKVFEKNNGIITTYHKVSGIKLTENETRWDDENNEVKTFNLEIEMTSFLNENYRKQEYPIETNIYNIEIAPEEETQHTIRNLAYLKLKTMPIWQDAEDC